MGYNLSRLTALSYHPDERISDRAVEDFGRLSRQIARHDPETVRNHLRRLFWLVSDESGGICPRAPELIGETIACSPGQFDEFISPLVYLLDMEPKDVPPFRPGILRAILRIGAGRPQVIAFARPLVRPLLDDPDPQVRGLAHEFVTLTF